MFDIGFEVSGCRVHSQQTMDNALKLSMGIELEWILAIEDRQCFFSG